MSIKSIFQKISKYKYPLIILAIMAIAYWRWLSFGIYSAGDWGFFYHQTARHYLDFSIWNGMVAFGSPDSWSWRLLLNLGYGAFGAMGFDKNISEKFLVFWPTFIVGAVGGFIFLRRFFSEKAAFIGVLVLNFNTYYLIGSTHFLLYSAGVFSVLAILAYMMAIEKGARYLYVLTAIGLLVTGSYDIRILYLSTAIIFAYFCFQNFFNKPSLALVKDKGVMLNHVLLGITLIGLYSFWIIGTYTASALLENETLGRNLFGNEYWNLSAALTLFHPFWTGDRSEWFVSHDVPTYFLAIPLAALAGLFLGRMNKIVIFFAAIAITGILLAKQVDEPFSTVYLWLYNNLPGFNAFREATKFYYLIAIGYAVVITALVDYLFRRKGKASQLFAWSVFSCLALVFIANIIPLSTGTLNAMYSEKHIPSDYAKFNNFLESNAGQYRVLWIPRFSRWSIYSPQQPRIDAAEFITSYMGESANGKSIRQVLVESLSARGDALLNTDIKYVVVPIRDIANSDDFYVDYGNERQYFINELDKSTLLRRVNMGTSELVVYENTRFKEHVNTTESLISLPQKGDIGAIHKFAADYLKTSDFNFVYDSRPFTSANAGIKTLFDDIDRNKIQTNRIVTDVSMATSGPKKLYANTNKPVLRYEVQNGVLSLIASNPNKVFINSRVLGQDIPEKTVLSAPVKTGEYYLNTGNILHEVVQNYAGNLGSQEGAVQLLKGSGINVIPNPSFEDGLWNAKVDNCNKYDDKPVISMVLDSEDTTDGSKSMKLQAGRHIACTRSGPLGVRGSSIYKFSFDYLTMGGRGGAYTISFNDSKKTNIKGDISSSREEWQSITRSINVPQGATELRLTVQAYPDSNESGKQAVSRFDNFKLEPLSLIREVAAAEPRYDEAKLEPGDIVQYVETGKTFQNLIPNNSLEDGLWAKEVGDCHAYDSRPEIGMRQQLRQASHGDKSLELEASRHIACTGPPAIKVNENSMYYFDFDYASPNGRVAGYNISFNDPKRTNYSEQLKIKGHDWNTFSKTFRAPTGATSMTLAVYSYSDSLSKRKVITRYDNFHFTKVPDIKNRYYLVSNSGAIHKRPQGVSFEKKHPTKVAIKITGATKPFYLNVNEAYHDRWRLMIKDENSTGLLNGWWPGIEPNEVSGHYKHNGLTNGWYVNVEELCKEGHNCVRNSDGSYEINLIAEFSPQRWFYIGGIISSLTLITAVAYVVVARRTRRLNDRD